MLFLKIEFVFDPCQEGEEMGEEEAEVVVHSEGRSNRQSDLFCDRIVQLRVHFFNFAYK